MNSISNIFLISKFESRVLMRSWFFRIFAAISMIFIIIFDLVLLFNDGPRWNTRAVPSVIPYANMIFMNVAQAIIISFLATDFLRRDKKLDTTEVIYIRSMSNGEYVLGKSIGALKVFFILNLVVLGLALVINLAMG